MDQHCRTSQYIAYFFCAIKIFILLVSPKFLIILTSSGCVLGVVVVRIDHSTALYKSCPHISCHIFSTGSAEHNLIYRWKSCLRRNRWSLSEKHFMPALCARCERYGVVHILLTARAEILQGTAIDVQTWNRFWLVAVKRMRWRRSCSCVLCSFRNTSFKVRVQCSKACMFTRFFIFCSHVSYLRKKKSKKIIIVFMLFHCLGTPGTFMTIEHFCLETLSAANISDTPSLFLLYLTRCSLPISRAFHTDYSSIFSIGELILRLLIHPWQEGHIRSCLQ